MMYLLKEKIENFSFNMNTMRDKNDFGYNPNEFETGINEELKQCLLKKVNEK